MAAAAWAGTIAGYGFLTQTGFGVMSSVQNLNQEFDDAKRACKQHKALSRLNDQLSVAIARGLTDSLEVQRLQSLTKGWEDATQDMQGWVTNLETRFLNSFTLYLFFLGILTIILFLALSRKSLRLKKLFAKIDRITSSTS